MRTGMTRGMSLPYKYVSNVKARTASEYCIDHGRRATTQTCPDNIIRIGNKSKQFPEIRVGKKLPQIKLPRMHVLHVIMYYPQSQRKRA